MSLDFSLIQPHKCEACGHLSQDGEQVFTTNITHNLGKMAAECGCYVALWRPEKHDYKFAHEIDPAVQMAIGRIKVNPSYYRQFDADNGWDTYGQFLPWLEEVHAALKQYPDARIEASR